MEAESIRLGKNEKKVLLALLNAPDSKIQQYYVSSEEGKCCLYRHDLMKVVWGKGNWNTNSQISQTLSTLRSKGLVRFLSRRKHVPITLTEEGQETALKLKVEIQSFVDEWSPFLGGGDK